MVTAAPAFLEEVKEAWVRTEVRRELHERFDLWLDSVGKVVKEESPSLEALTWRPWAVLARRQELTAMVTEALVKRSHQQALEQKSMPCPQCGHMLQARASVSRTVDTLVGEATLERPYFYCVGCGRGVHPLDETLELAGRRKAVGYSRSWDPAWPPRFPFETAQELFSQLTGLSLSGHTTHEVVGEVGQGLGVPEVSPTAEEIVQRVAEVAQGKKQPPILVLGLDGAHVPK